MKRACELTSLSRTMLNRYRAEGRFPAAVPLGDKRIAFIKSEIIIAAGIGGIPRTDAKVEILASSLSTEPLRLDTLTIKSKWWQITEISRDPAGAWWELQCQSVSAPA